MTPGARAILPFVSVILVGLLPATAAAAGDMFTLPGKAPADPPTEPPPEVPPLLVPGVGPRWQLGATLYGSAYSLNYATSTPTPAVNGNSASGNLELIHFLAPVVDDGAPRSLQPFLQRTSQISVSFGAGGFVTRNPNPGGQDRTDSNLGARAGFDVYATRWLALTGSFGYGYDVLHDFMVDQSSHSFTGSAGFGLRADDARFDLTYTFSAATTDGSFAPLRWGTAQLTAYVVVARSFSMNLWGRAIQSGGMGGVDLEYYPTQNLGIFAGGFGGRGELYSTEVLVTRVGGDAGVGYWVTPRLRLVAEYAFTANAVAAYTVSQQEYDPYTELTHTLSASAALRLP